MGWIFAGLVFLVAAIALFQQRSSHTKTVQSLRDINARKLEEQQTEASHKIEELEKRLARLTREQETTSARAHLPLAKELLSGLDDLERAIDLARQKEEDAAQKELTKGLEMVSASFHKALARHGITPISPEKSTEFDPAIHEAITVTEDAELPHNSVHQLLRTGWQHETQLLRPAMVQISQQPVHEDSFEKTMPEIPSSKSQEIAFSFDSLREEEEEEEVQLPPAEEEEAVEHQEREEVEAVEEVVERS
jgi:molecular chaperone GrpE